MVDLVFDPHAELRMRRRQIPRLVVQQIVADADEILERDDGRTEYTGSWERRVITVVTQGKEEPLLVVTVIDRTRSSR
jgi:Domain of unknown function (DUF4258)